jgi:hypothetical protein
MDLVPATNDNVNNPTGSVWYLRDAVTQGNLFSFNMHYADLDAHYKSDIIRTINGRTCTVTINDASIKDFVIVHDWLNSVESPQAGLPLETKLISVYPNPVQNATQVNFGLLNSGKVRIDVIDALGNVVKVLTNADYNAGTYTINWMSLDNSGMQLPNGSYTVRMTSGFETSILKVNVVR